MDIDTKGQRKNSVKEYKICGILLEYKKRNMFSNGGIFLWVKVEVNLNNVWTGSIEREREWEGGTHLSIYNT